MIAIESRIQIAVGDVVGQVLIGYRKATKFLTPDLVVKATGRHKPTKRSRQTEVILVVGKPNYAEREFIRQAKKAAEPFPVRRIQVKEWK